MRLWGIEIALNMWWNPGSPLMEESQEEVNTFSQSLAPIVAHLCLPALTLPHHLFGPLGLHSCNLAALYKFFTGKAKPEATD